MLRGREGLLVRRQEEQYARWVWIPTNTVRTYSLTGHSQGDRLVWVTARDNLPEQDALLTALLRSTVPAQNSGNVPHTSCAKARAALLRAEPPTAGLSAWTAGAKRACGASVKAAYRAVTPKGTLCFESDTARQMGNHWHVTTRCERIAKLSGPGLGRESMAVRSPASWMKVEKYSQSRARGVGGTPTRRGLARSPHASHRTTGVCNIWILRKKQWHQAVVF